MTPQDMRVIYGSTKQERAITVGHIAATSGISGNLDLGRLVTRHSAIVGSTGSGKSNLVAVLMEAIATQGFPAARVLIIDPHGEYSSAVGQHGRVFRTNPRQNKGELPLCVPYWALPFDELQAVALGPMQSGAETAVRDAVRARKKEAAMHLASRPPAAAITADSPIPFNVNLGGRVKSGHLWTPQIRPFLASRDGSLSSTSWLVCWARVTESQDTRVGEGRAGRSVPSREVFCFRDLALLLRQRAVSPGADWWSRLGCEAGPQGP